MKEKTKKRKQCERNEEATEDSFSSHGAQSSDHKRPKGHPGSKSWGGAIKSSFLSHFEKVKGKGSKTTDPATEKSERKGQPNHQESKSAPAPSGNRAVGLHKNRRNGEARGHENTTGGEHAAKSIHNHPFPTEYGDHFETSKVAIHDISPLLEQFAKLCGKQKSSLAVYDPYYCDGAVIEHFRQEGFHNVHNQNVDCYKVWKSTPVSSKFDIVVTNPPFSGDHKQKCLEHCVSKEKAWMVLLPAYCATKNYFTELMSNWRERGKVFFAVPKVRYDFEHPEGTGHAVSPFFSIWFLYLGKHSDEIFSWYQKRHGNDGSLKLVRTVEDLAANKAVDNRKRLNPRQRAALKKKQQKPT